MFDYPQPGFHFSVIFELFPQFPNDIRFQEVSGLSVDTEFEALAEGGENRFSHQLPTKTTYRDLQLKRGKYNWYVINAVPKSLDISGINAMTNEIVVESLTLKYQYFKYYDPVSVALDAAGSISGSVSIG